MIGIGWWELALLLIVGGALLAVAVVVITLVIRTSQSGGSDRLAQLEEENLRLRKLLAENGIPHGGTPPKK